MTMKILTIKPPIGYVAGLSAPLDAMRTVCNIAKVYPSTTRIQLVDIAFTPEHAHTIYVWKLWYEMQSAETWFLWSDATGNAGIAVTEEEVELLGL